MARPSAGLVRKFSMVESHFWLRRSSEGTEKLFLSDIIDVEELGAVFDFKVWSNSGNQIAGEVMREITVFCSK